MPDRLSQAVTHIVIVSRPSTECRHDRVAGGTALWRSVRWRVPDLNCRDGGDDLHWNESWLWQPASLMCSWRGIDSLRSVCEADSLWRVEAWQVRSLHPLLVNVTLGVLSVWGRQLMTCRSVTGVFPPSAPCQGDAGCAECVRQSAYDVSKRDRCVPSIRSLSRWRWVCWVCEAVSLWRVEAWQVCSLHPLLVKVTLGVLSVWGRQLMMCRSVTGVFPPSAPCQGDAGCAECVRQTAYDVSENGQIDRALLAVCCKQTSGDAECVRQTAYDVSENGHIDRALLAVCCKQTSGADNWSGCFHFGRSFVCVLTMTFNKRTIKTFRFNCQPVLIFFWPVPQPAR